MLLKENGAATAAPGDCCFITHAAGGQLGGHDQRMSPQYLPLYLSEISYRYNHRTEDDLFLTVLKNTLLTDQQVAETSRNS